ncbi:MAG TPA: penicillin-binding protein activator LpoB [Gammaproteobacteria bacterium]|nr:penicillin-binding protein activator LpoB [Gammaproteobacteria bacterium]
MSPIYRKNAGILVSLFAAVMLCAGCSTNPKIDRIEANTVTDLSGDWNDTDSRLVAEEMIQDSLSHPWLANYTRAKHKQPVVIVGEVRNLSHEHINVDTFVNDMERALINSGRVEFVASRDERGEIREERLDQDLNAREDTRKAAGQEIGADFMLKGTINTIIDAIDKQQTRYYQVDLTLISMADNRKVWTGQKKIKKAIKNPKYRF